jgi:hypothetical protein
MQSSPPQQVPPHIQSTSKPDPFYGHEYIAPMRSFHHASVRLSRIPAHIYGFTSKTPLFYSLRTASDQTSFIRHVYRPHPSPALKSLFSHRPRVLGSSTFHLRFHDRVKGYLRRHVFEQIVAQGMFTSAGSTRWNARWVAILSGNSLDSRGIVM